MRKRTLWLGLSFLLVADLVLTGCPAEEVEPVVPVPGVPQHCNLGQRPAPRAGGGIKSYNTVRGRCCGYY